MNSFEPARERVAATPTLVIDESIVEKNLRRLMDYAQTQSLNVRPHTKTHKSRNMARRQMVAGACGLTVAKVGEAESLATEWLDLLMAYPAVDPVRCHRLAELAVARRIRVAVDSVEGIDALRNAAKATGSKIGILVDVDVGLHRTGVSSADESLRLAQHVVRHPDALRLDGLMFYPGHILSRGDEQAKQLREVDELLGWHLNGWQDSGLEAGIVSGGSTPTLYQSHLVTRQTEIRPGTSIYNDMNMVRGGFCELEECAAAVICTVVSRAVIGKAVIDGGSKTFSSDRNATCPDSGHGMVLEYPQAKLTRLTEEHGELDLSACERTPQIGERVSVIPNHICPCINLHDSVQLQAADGTLKTMQIDARGQLV